MKLTALAAGLLLITLGLVVFAMTVRDATAVTQWLGLPPYSREAAVVIAALWFSSFGVAGGAWLTRRALRAERHS